MANTDNPNGFVALRVEGNAGPIPVWTRTMASNAGCKVGDALTLATTGLLSIALAASTNIAGVATKTITAVAATRQDVDFVPALPNIVFAGQCSGNFAVTDVGEQVDLEGATGVMEVNEDASSTDVIVVQGLAKYPLNNAYGTNARIEFTFNPTKCIFSAGA